MTLSERNNFFKAGIVSCAVCAILVITATFFTMPLYSENLIEPPADGNKSLISSIAGLNYFAVHISLLFFAVFSLAGMILIYYYFERTSTPEILYIAFFVVSCSFEVIRIIIPLQLVIQFPLIYIITGMRILLFARFFGIFSLFTAGICSTGFEIQRMRNAILIITIAAMILTMGIPIDALNWNASFNAVNGYNSMFRMIELVVFITIIASFLITAKNKDSKEYVHAAFGIMIALIGRNFLQNTDNWIGAILGIIMLSFGMLTLCTKLHKIHLWL